MSRSSWLVDGNRFATKIKSASSSSVPSEVNWNSNPTKECPNCQYIIDNSDILQEWPGLPRGVKFDPSDQEIIWHLLAKVGVGSLKPHQYIEEFIPTVNEDDGICYTHPQNLPGVKEDGTVSHFFHRAIKAYNTGTRKRRKIHGDSFGDVRWHKTGRTKPVLLDGVQQGCKKIMVLYVSPSKGGKPEKTNWVMHQYHLGTQEDEREGEYVVSKVFHQQPQVKLTEKNEVELPEDVDTMIVKVDPVTPKSVTPDPPSTESPFVNYNEGQELVDPSAKYHDVRFMEDAVPAQILKLNSENMITSKDDPEQMEEKNGNDNVEEQKWWDSESQYLLDSQQLVEGLSLCDELLQSQSPSRDGTSTGQELKSKPCLSDYAQLGTELWKKDLEDCQNLNLDPPNTDNDAADFRLSQIEFGSQDSYISWGGHKISFETGDLGSS